MRLVIIILLTFLLLYCALVRPIMRQPVMKITAIVLAVCLIPLGILEIRWQRTEQVGSETVRYVSGNPNGYLVCQRFTQALLDISNRAGEVSTREPDMAYIHYETCENFQAWLASDKKKPTLDQIIAVHVLTHESVHVSGDFNEASTECKAINLDPKTAEHLGASVTVAQQMQQRYIKEVYPYLGSAYRGTCPITN